MTVNLTRMRAGDKIHCADEKTYTVKDCWSAGGIFQLTTEEFPDEIWTYTIGGGSLNDKVNIHELEEVKQPDDDNIYYLPKFEVEMLPILNVNGEDRIVMQLLDLNGLEVKGSQTLTACYKYVVVGRLYKKQGRDMEVLKEEKIICDSKEDCENKLQAIELQFTGDKPEAFGKELKECCAKSMISTQESES